ncbi:MAG TPA: hypothetical protein VHZ73_09260 [Vicinamibacterales bacterium]|nr:hypothetical protein [Vicinamibacterales bacterium]
MRTHFMTAAAMALAMTTVFAQVDEKKPVPKDSVRVQLAGCTKGYVFTVGPHMQDVVSDTNIPPGTHIRMNGPKKLISDINAYTSSMVSITGLMKKGQLGSGPGIGGVHFSPIPSGGAGGVGVSQSAVANQTQIDVEGWAPSTGVCEARP